MTSEPDYYCDVLIIGSGAAGLSLALRLASYYKIIVLSKTQLNECCTFYAQGGIAAVFDKNDSIESHIEDTMIAGAGLCDINTVRFVVTNAMHCVQWLIKKGILFDKKESKYQDAKDIYHLTREGGHSYRRILHTNDATGRTLENLLINQSLAESNIHIFENTVAIDLILSDALSITGKRRVVGAWIKSKNSKHIETCRANVIVLATGGASNVYKNTTNPPIISGDGIAMAWRAGCRVANLEFNQFHPTCLYHSNAKNFLLTEALRGEGAWLLRPDGTRFMPDFDPRAELAPRDIVVRAISQEIKRLGTNCMYLDISHKSKNFICSHFPNIYKNLLKFDLDLTKQPIPIISAAHYTCGGIVVNLQGKTDVDGLYAIGEVSYTGLHGANRIASNSLLECIVYSWSLSREIIHHFPNIINIKTLPTWYEQHNKKRGNKDWVIPSHWTELRVLMSDYMGVIRTTEGLQKAMQKITLLKKEIDECYKSFIYSNELLEFRNLVQIASLMVQCAIYRKESRGVHYIIDYCNYLDISKPTILIPKST